MRTSDQTNEISKAIHLAQGKMPKASKEAKGYQYKYTRLEDYWDACRDVLQENNLIVIQFPEYVDDHVAVTTRVEHTSGQFYESTMKLPVTKKDPKEIGALITYAKKYGLSSMLGIVGSEEDPDAETAPPKPVKSMDGRDTNRRFEPPKKVTTQDIKDLVLAATTKSHLNNAISLGNQHLTEDEKASIRPMIKDKKAQFEAAG